MSRFLRLFSDLARVARDELSKADQQQKETLLSSLARKMRDRIGSFRNGTGAGSGPPVTPPPIQTRSRDDDDEGDSIELLGRDASYDEELWDRVQQNAHLVQSSNVYSYSFEHETSTDGILFVTYLHWEPGIGQDKRSGAGATYAYYDFPKRKYLEFARASAESAGKAVWDYCRVRHSRSEHQHRYRLIQVTGEYVPRLASKTGFVRRTLVTPGMTPMERRNLLNARSDGPSPLTHMRRSTLPAAPYRAAPNRARPNRGTQRETDFNDD